MVSSVIVYFLPVGKIDTTTHLRPKAPYLPHPSLRSSVILVIVPSPWLSKIGSSLSVSRLTANASLASFAVSLSTGVTVLALGCDYVTASDTRP